ncbi:MAG: scyllo-inositol 2-dehydrogenase (NADP+) [Cyclobacteriaceae bacterium]|jgi:scyllo-inositol 2-dehydrogenase (NADP+)
MKIINAALLSYGMSGQVFHAPFLNLHPGFNLLGSWERSKKWIQMDYPSTRSYQSLEDVLADDQVELVIVNTPTYSHYEYAKKALEAGKHVVVEKAFTTTTDEAMELRDLAKAKNLKLAVFQNRRWDSDFKTVKEVVDKGMIGEVVEATIGFMRYSPALSPKTHKEKPSPGAGIIKDLGAHVIDQALCLFGMPKSVFADIGITRAHSEVDDYFDILLSYDQAHVHVKGGYFYREPGPSFVIHGTKGSFLKSRADVQEDQLKAGKRPSDQGYGIEPVSEEGLLHTEKNGKLIWEKIKTHKGDYMAYYEGVYQSIANDGVEPVTSQEGVNSMKVIEAAFESATKGVRVVIS